MKRLVLSLIILLVLIALWSFRQELLGYINELKLPNSPVIIFPPVESKVTVKKDFENKSLASEMSQFIQAEAKEKILSKLNYSGVDSAHTGGFEVAYKIYSPDYSLKDFYKKQTDLIHNTNWNLLAGNIKGSQMFLEAEYKKQAADYKMRLTAEDGGNYLQVSVQFLINYD